MCQEKKMVEEMSETVVLCCDRHLTPGFHYDQLQDVEWRVPGAEVPARPSNPPKVMRARVLCDAA